MTPPPGGGDATPLQEHCACLWNSIRDGTDYLGWTTRLSRRLVEHNNGLSSFSRRKRPWRLVGCEIYRSPEAAKARERALKRNPHMMQLFKKRMLNRAAIGRSRQVVG